MPTPSEIALKKLEQVIGRDPLLREVVHRTLPRQGTEQFNPDVDIIDLTDRYVLLFDVPGLTRDSLTVELVGTKLIVEGNRALRHPEGGRVKVNERSHGVFHREFLLPAAVDGGAVTAKMADGVLTIEVPRAERSRTVKVEVG